MRAARSRSSSTCASPGSTSARASRARSSCRCARSRRGSARSIRRRTWWPSAITAAAARRWRSFSRRTATGSTTSWGASMRGRGQSILRFRLTSALVLAAFAVPAAAEDLLQVYRDAQRYAAVYAGARYTLEATRERIPQARSGLLPNLNLTASATAQRINVESSDQTVSPSFTRSPTTSGYTLQATQPVYRPQNLIARDQADFQVRQGEATFGQAAQDLEL